MTKPVAFDGWQLLAALRKAGDRPRHDALLDHLVGAHLPDGGRSMAADRAEGDERRHVNACRLAVNLFRYAAA